MAKELDEAKAKVIELETQLNSTMEESVSLKGENNSLKKKVQSLQTDVEKMSRKVTQLYSGDGESQDDAIQDIVNADASGTSSSLHNANVNSGLGARNSNLNALNQSIRSDNAAKSKRFDMMAGNDFMSDDDQDDNYFKQTGDKYGRSNTLIHKLAETHISHDNTNVLIAEEVKSGMHRQEDTDNSTPHSILQMLADENISMKEDLELKLGQIMDYKVMIQEYSDKLQSEIEKNNHF